MQSINEKNRIFNFSLLPVIFALAWPTMLEEVLYTAVQYIDTAMVGTLGTEATAAVGCTTTVGWLIGSSVSALGVGFLSYISQACGAGDKDKARKAVGQVLLVLIVAGLLFTVLTLSLSSYVPVWMQVDEKIRPVASRYFFILYLPMFFRASCILLAKVFEAFSDTKTPLKVGILTNLTNVVLNFLMIYETRTVVILGASVKIYGAGMGVIGAARASAVAYTVGGIAALAALFRNRDIVPKTPPLKADPEVLKPCLNVAIPNMLQRFCTSLGYVVFASMINSLGEISTAAHTIANTVESAFYIPGYGMMTSAAVLTGNCIGAKDDVKRKQYSNLIWLCEFLMMCITGGLLFVYTENMVSLFTKDAVVLVLCCTVLKMVALSEPFYGISIVTEGMLMGAGKTKRPFVFNVSCMWGIRIVGTFICINIAGFGLESAWGCMIAGNIGLMLLLILYYRSIKWYN